MIYDFSTIVPLLRFEQSSYNSVDAVLYVIHEVARLSRSFLADCFGSMDISSCRQFQCVLPTEPVEAVQQQGPSQ